MMWIANIRQKWIVGDRKILFKTLCILVTISVTRSSTTSSSLPTTTEQPICPQSPITLNISSDLNVGSVNKINIQCSRPNDQLKFNINGEGFSTDYALVLGEGGYPYFRNNVVPKTFKQGQEFQFFMLMRSNDEKQQLIPIYIRVIEVNDPPVIRNITYSIDEGIGPLYSRRTISIRVTDPDSRNGWGNVTVTSPDLPEQFVLGNCIGGYCLRIVKPLDADIYSQQGSSNFRPELLMVPDELDLIFPDELNLESSGEIHPFEQNLNLIPGPPILNFSLVATDGGNLSSMAKVSIRINDLNDNAPVCRSPETIHASPTFNPEVNNVLNLFSYCTDADNTARNRISEDGYKILTPQDCPNVFAMRGAVLNSDVRYLSPNVKTCTVTVAVDDNRFATTMTMKVIFGRCPAGYDDSGRYWNETDPGTHAFSPCPVGHRGSIMRYCDLNATFEEPVYNCVKLAIQNIYNTIRFSNQPLNNVIKGVIQELGNETDAETTELFKGDVETAVDILGAVNDRVERESLNTTDFADDYIDVANNLIAEGNTKSWRSLISVGRYGAESVLQHVDTFAEKLLRENDTDGTEYSRSNMFMKVSRQPNCSQNIDFPNRNSTNIPTWAQGRQDSIQVKCDGRYSSYSTSIYRNISSIMQSTFKRDRSSQTTTPPRQINSPVISLTLYSQTLNMLQSPATITFQTYNVQLEKPVCSFWKFGSILGQGSWATDGCRLDSYDKLTGIAVCKCDHLTNFAILMSPTSQISETDQIALSIISVIGCVISCICLVITVTLHAIFYRAVKSDRTTILLNLCVTLFLAYIVFLVGVNRVENKAACTAVSMILHFLYLSVFGLMLAEGVDLGYRAFSKTTKYPVGRFFTIGAYVGSAVIVGISAGATQLRGYGNSQSCWLSVESGLVWAFIVPALLVILVNIAIAVCVLRQLFGLSAIQQKSNIDKAKAGIRGVLVMLPVMGLAWIFGVFSVSKSTVTFQYFFAILNSTQGVLLFIFHCVLNKKIQESFRSAKTRFLSQESETGYTNKTNTKKSETSAM